VKPSQEGHAAFHVAGHKVRSEQPHVCTDRRRMA
jgi:hypothetical protein